MWSGVLTGIMKVVDWKRLWTGRTNSGVASNLRDGSGQSRRLSRGLTVSAVLHLAIFASLVLVPGPKALGHFGYEGGNGVASGNAAGPTLQSFRLAEVQLVGPSSLHGDPSAGHSGVAAGLDDTLANLDDMRPKSANDSALFIPIEPTLAGGSGAEGGMTATSPGGGDSSSGGDPLADSELLAQIAKCLPANVRPTLKLANLALEIGSEGELRVAPRVDGTLPLLSAEDRLLADQTVQAALQCGPYDKPSFRNRVFALVADFSILPQETMTSSQGIGAQPASPPKP